MVVRLCNGMARILICMGALPLKCFGSRLGNLVRVVGASYQTQMGFFSPGNILSFQGLVGVSCWFFLPYMDMHTSRVAVEYARSILWYMQVKWLWVY